MKLYWTGDVGYSYTDQVTGKALGITAIGVQADLESLNGGPLDADLFTYGGDFDEGVRINELIRAYPGPKKLYLRSVVASAGTVIALAFKKENTKAGKLTRFMIHNAAGWVGGDHNAIRERADHFERLSDMIATEYAERTGKTVKEMKALMDAETWYMGQQIIDEGFAGELDNFDTAETASLLSVESARMEFRAKVQMWSGRSMMTAPTASLEEMKEVESLIESGSFDKLAPVPTDAELSVKKYPIAKNGKVFRSSLRAISARAAKDDPELAKWATAMIAKIDAKGAIKVNEEEIVAYLKDKPAVFARVAEASGHGAMLATPEQKSAVEMKAKLVAANAPDPVATIVQLRADLEAVETDRVTNIMDATFGPVKLTTGKENTLRTYAGVKLAGVKAVDLAAKIEEFKKDTLALKLAGELMDANSEVNLIGFVETKVQNKAPATYDGVPVVTV